MADPHEVIVLAADGDTVRVPVHWTSWTEFWVSARRIALHFESNIISIEWGTSKTETWIKLSDGWSLLLPA